MSSVAPISPSTTVVQHRSADIASLYRRMSNGQLCRIRPKKEPLCGKTCVIALSLVISGVALTALVVVLCCCLAVRRRREKRQKVAQKALEEERVYPGDDKVAMDTSDFTDPVLSRQESKVATDLSPVVKCNYLTGSSDTGASMGRTLISRSPASEDEVVQMSQKSFKPLALQAQRPGLDDTLQEAREQRMRNFVRKTRLGMGNRIRGYDTAICPEVSAYSIEDDLMK
ncbi:hypothetical protein JKF63_03920 [Porcisia hertigi]|uniref:Uncharacterized protein n=1 Tax=Porcisia hertigi TaxID=2761500 RepID=A0A836I6J6_9TRYP|nr:hypothetical protein JKF63_03920 [Porcisia hertigi]